MWDLNSLLDESGAGWTLASAQGINNLGQIIGTGFHDGRMAAFILNPVPDSCDYLLCRKSGDLLGPVI